MAENMRTDWVERAVADPKRIVLADAGDPRVDEAAKILTDRGLAIPILVDDLDAVRSDAVIAAGEALGDKVDLDDPLHVAVLMVKVGEADGCVAGATRSTADVLRAGIRVLGVAPGTSVISSSFFMVLSDGRTIGYGDCGVLPDPDAAQLADVAISSAKTFHELSGLELSLIHI